MNILLVEDDEIDVLAIKRAFAAHKMPHQLFHAANGLQALEILRRKEGEEFFVRPPRLVLLDLNMPRMNGLEFLGELRADADSRINSTAVIVLTNSNLVRDRDAVNELGVSGYFLKSGELDEFIEVLAAFTGELTTRDN